MFRSPSTSPQLLFCAPSSSSSESSSQSTTGKHSPPLWSTNDKLILQIKDFLDNGLYDVDSNDLVLSVKPVEFVAWRRELRRPRFLDPTQVPSIRYTWNRQTCILTVPCMAGPVHDAVIPFLSYFREDMPSSHPTTHSERRSITFFTGTTVPILPNPSSSIVTGRGKHVVGVYKEPDAAFGYLDRRPNGTSPTITAGGCPRVVFEVAFSQTYESVLEDARQWLVRTQGRVKLCVIVKIYEQPNRRIPAGTTPETVEQQHVDNDASPEAGFAPDSRSGNPTTVLASLPLDDDRMASMDGRDHFRNSTAEHSRWVGPLTGFVELYRLAEDSTGIVRDGQRYDLFDPSGPDPTIMISDLLPPGAIEGAVDRAYPLALADYRVFIQQGVQDLALLRKSKMQKGDGKKAREDAGYATDDAESGESSEGHE